jgi:hypothetical protein
MTPAANAVEKKIVMATKSRAGYCANCKFSWMRRFVWIDYAAIQHHDQHGPATLNVLLSFAQFEREVIGERL